MRPVVGALVMVPKLPSKSSELKPAGTPARRGRSMPAYGFAGIGILAAGVAHEIGRGDKGLGSVPGLELLSDPYQENAATDLGRQTINMALQALLAVR